MPLFISQKNQWELVMQDYRQSVYDNPLIDNETMIAMFESIAADVAIYESTGVDAIIPALQAHIDTNGPYKAFLLGYADEGETVTVFQTIQTAINGQL